MIGSPGPATYNTDTRSTRAKSACCTFGNHKRDLLYNTIDVTPGPSSYNTLYTKINMKKSPNCIFGDSKRGLERNWGSREPSPGPSSYNTNTSIKVNRSPSCQ